MITFKTGCLCAGGLIASASAAFYGYEKHLLSNALKSMNENQLAMVTDGAFFGSYSFTVVKVSLNEKPQVVGAVCIIIRDVLSRRKAWDLSVEVYGPEEIRPIGKYLSFTRWTLLNPIARVVNSVANLPIIIPSKEEARSGYYSHNLFNNWKNSGNAVKRQ